MFVLKKDASLCFCVGYRKLNRETVQGSYLLLRLDECNDSFEDATVFSTLDETKGYWKIEVKEADRDETVFIL